MKIDTKKLTNLFHNQLFQNITSLLGARVARYFLPLISIPYLARVLGAEGWGLLAFSQAFAAFLSLIIEYGFSLSATRDLSQIQTQKNAISIQTGSVIFAKVLLSILAVSGSCVVFFFIPIFTENPTFFIWAVILAVVQGSNLIWYFQGVEKLKLAVAIEVALDALAVALYLVFVTAPGDGWMVLALLSASNLLSFFIHLGLIYAQIPFYKPTIQKAFVVIKKGWSLFLFRSGVSLYTTANPVILGLFVEPRIVGYFVGAEKIIKALTGLMQPVSRAIFPRVSALMQKSKEKAQKLVNISLVVLLGIGFLMSAACFLLAPALINLFLGAEYAASVPVLQIMALIPVLVALSSVLGVQWAIPLGFEKTFNKIIVLAGVVNVALSFLLAPLFKHIGMAISITIIEIAVAAGILAMLWKKDQLPFDISVIFKNRSNEI